MAAKSSIGCLRSASVRGETGSQAPVGVVFVPRSTEPQSEPLPSYGIYGRVDNRLGLPVGGSLIGLTLLHGAQYDAIQ